MMSIVGRLFARIPICSSFVYSLNSSIAVRTFIVGYSGVQIRQVSCLNSILMKCRLVSFDSIQFDTCCCSFPFVLFRFVLFCFVLLSNYYSRNEDTFSTATTMVIHTVLLQRIDEDSNNNRKYIRGLFI
mmetsp:Transcript_42825/g.43565  ORF Transcript_42825/g.43565 Transcript_42825/m.43565 type:complete len:129 (-) Transcript_42825:568-954(-)